MARVFSDENWRTILELSEQVAALPESERSAYLDAAAVEPQVISEVLEIAAQFQQENPPAERLEARLGTSVGRFFITGVLGSGGMGDVYSARDTDLDRPVALKFLRPEMLGYSAVYQSFIREAQTASALNHPNIVTVYEIVRADSATAIVMELAEGLPLRTICSGRQNPIARVFEIGEQIASALAAAHGRGIVHGDVKPENVLVQPDGRVKVLDFGLARQVLNSSSGASSLFAAGTLRYFSPEQARGDTAGPSSDVFSLGLVLYELAAGCHPFGGDSPLDTVHAILNGQPEQLHPDGRIPQQFTALVGAMLSKDQAQRPSAGEAAQALGQMARRLSEQKHRAAKPWRSRLLALASVGATILTLAAVLWIKFRPVSDFDSRNLHIQPLTSQPGWEADPAFSPDGKYIAFTWSDHPENPQIYVKRLDGGEPVKITDNLAGHIGALAWSPDGKRIAYKIQLRGSNGGEILTIPPNGGAGKVVTTLANANVTSGLDWSPDGGKIVFSDSPRGSSQLALYIYKLQTGEKVELTTPPAGMWGDWSPAFSPDGKTIAFKRVAGYWLDEIYLMPANGGRARQLTSIQAGIWGHAWTASGKALLISCQRGSTIQGIWRFPLSDPLRPERIQEGAGDLITPVMARKTNTIAWVNRTWDSNIYRAPTSGAAPPERLIASTQRDQNPAVSPDGRIAFVSDRSGSREIWMAASNGERQTQVTAFRGPQIDSLMWSPDGRRLAFESRLRGQSGILTIDCAPEAAKCGEPQQVVAQASAPAWSADGKAIYYTTERSGSAQVWRHSLIGGADRQMTQIGGCFSRETPDGKWLYFSQSGAETIYRLAVQPLPSAVSAEPLTDSSIHLLPLGWDISREEVLFFELPSEQERWSIRALGIASGRVRYVREWGDAYIGTDGMVLSVSRDGKWVYYPRLDSAGANIIVAKTAK
ncbi:MAG TPA: protein kinase [Bryobacteraceae bacterium]|nr:protein kinase [Bryobacteraceae bacterium]